MLHSLVVRFTFTCSACGVQHSDCYKVPAGTEVPRPRLPVGWRLLDNFYLCGDHKVVLRVTGLLDDAPPELEIAL